MFIPVQIIEKKRDGKELSRAEIHSFIQGLADNTVADYQAAAFLMAVYFRGMTLDETVALTEAMLESGERYDLSSIPGAKIDKHSTGGVGDKVSLILAPLAASCGLRVPMMSGRGLGATGGTLDKLESISGFQTDLSRTRFEEMLGRVGCAMIGQSKKMVPADKILYSLRDVTGTVESIPLIVASILSKKIAEGTEGLVIDLKIGSGAFMKTKESGRKLAKTLVTVARKMGLQCRAVLTSMEQPLGCAVGNSLEVLESIEILRNAKFGADSAHKTRAIAGVSECGSSDLKELTIQLCAHMLEMGGKAKSLVEGRKVAHARLADGSAWRAFQSMVEAQGGDMAQIEDPRKLPIAKETWVLRARKRGYLTRMNTENIGRVALGLGAGRKKASDTVDHAVGLVFHRKLGARVAAGDAIATAYLPKKVVEKAELETLFHDSIDISGARKPVPKLIFEVIT